MVSCASERNFRPIPPGEGPSASRFAELRHERQIATIHFPRGIYTLAAEDNGGYYYRAPRPITKHAFAGAQPYEGGIYLPKENQKLRGYIVWAGGRTKIGNLSRAQVEFRDQRELAPIADDPGVPNDPEADTLAPAVDVSARPR